jgi:hypothetical protein
VCSPAKSSIRRVESAYVTGLLDLHHKTLSEMRYAGLLPFSIRHSSTLLAADPLPHRSSLRKRLRSAPVGGVLAVDLTPVLHEGSSIEGVSRVYSSSANGVIWGHTYLSSALTFEDADAYPLQLAPFVTEAMSTETYPRLNASEALLGIVGDVLKAGYRPRAVVFDAQFSTRLTLRTLKVLDLPFVGRCRTDLWVVQGKKRVQVKELAERYRPGQSRYYARFGRYAKRVQVRIEDVGTVSLVLIWKAKGVGWECLALVSTAKEGVQGVLGIWASRWRLEVGHRLFKQAFGLGKCQCRRLAAQLKHVDLVLTAFLEVRLERLRSPHLGWRRAQEVVAARRRNTVLTGLQPLVA